MKDKDVIYEDADKAPIYTLIAEDGTEDDYMCRAQMVIDGKLYFALATKEDWENDDFGICLVTEDGDDMLFETIEDDDEFDKVEDQFNDMLFNEVDYDEN